MAQSKRRRRLWPWVLLGIAVSLAMRFAFWGRPLPARYAVIGQASQGSNGRLEWLIERRTSSAVLTWRAGDTNGDGVMDEFHTPEGVFQRPGLRSEPKRWLVVCLDGVPLDRKSVV